MSATHQRVVLWGSVSGFLGLVAFAYVLFTPHVRSVSDTTDIRGIHTLTTQYMSLAQEGLSPAYFAFYGITCAFLIAILLSAWFSAFIRKQQWGTVLLFLAAGLFVLALLHITLALTWQTPRTLAAMPLSLSRASFQLFSDPLGLLLLPSVALAGLAAVSAVRGGRATNR
jgi:hypothetical protein